MKVTRSAYYSWLNGETYIKKQESDKDMLKNIRVVYNYSKGSYGSPRIAKELSVRGVMVSRRRVAKLMREDGIRSRIRKRHKIRTTDSSHPYPIVENKLSRQFEVKELSKAPETSPRQKKARK